MGPQKHEYIAIFSVEKMSGYECARAMRKKLELAQAYDECRGNKRNESGACFLGLREHEVRSNLVAVRGKTPFCQTSYMLNFRIVMNRQLPVKVAR